DAQPICCHDCGPEIFLLNEKSKNLEAISTAREALHKGQIVAIKGIGGFHLCCDAANDMAVQLLRARKHRQTKPFAIMVCDIEVARAIAFLTQEEENLLSSWQKPILLCNKKKITPYVCDSIAPNNPTLGIMLPYTPLHLLLFRLNDSLPQFQALVMTSANVSGAPIARTNNDASQQLSGLADHILTHKRHINIRADDSVGYFNGTNLTLLRRSRGFAPLPIMVKGSFQKAVLGIGCELKNTFCLAQNGLFYLSPHIGDLADVRAHTSLAQSLKRMEDLLRIKPLFVACDLHPNYFSSQFAKELNLPIITVQHHYSHVLSCMAEHDIQEPVLGVAYDGTGYGLDGSIWGGEILLADTTHFERVAHITPFPQTGGDSSVREGYRIAVNMLKCSFSREDTLFLCSHFNLCSKQEADFLLQMAEKNINTVTSTSMGRLFDAVSAILGFAKSSSFEGEAAMLLQFAAEKANPDVTKKLTTKYQNQLLPTTSLPTQTLFTLIALEARQKTDLNALALFFHKSIAKMTAIQCQMLSEKYHIKTCVLTGGVFQNKLLLQLTHEELTHC
ncbi:MAG: carbamoyltransferase HypF, partial [Desulfovibrio sp.]|nr:carbamoyltransferase HypF [Desulfovibrio sp.]